MKKKYLLMGITAALVVAVAVSGSLAAVSAAGRQVTNALAAPTLEVGITNAYTVEMKDALPGDTLEEEATSFQVQNVAETDEYTRVTIQKYWVDGEEVKNFDLDASLLTLSVNDASWITASGGFDLTSGETDVFYYNKPLDPGASVSLPLTITISNEADNSYQDMAIRLEVTVDSVQFVAGENQLNQDGILNTFGVLADLGSDGSILSLAQ